MTKSKYNKDIIERAQRIVEYIPQIMKAMSRGMKVEEDCTEFEKLHFHHYQIMRIVSLTPNCSTNDIKNVLMLAQSTVSQHLSKLLGEGLIKIEDDPTDRRKTSITLTEKGQEILDLRIQMLVEKHARYLMLLEEEDRDLFEESFLNLVKIAKKIEHKFTENRGNQ